MKHYLNSVVSDNEPLLVHRQGASGNQQAMKKIAILLAELREHPFTGSGKPEALKYSLTGY